MSWVIEVTEQFERDAKAFAKKHPAAYLAVMENLNKYYEALCEAKHPKLVQFGFIHEEPKGIRAIDQSGGTLANGKKRGRLIETRLYTYAYLESNVLHLICMGDKTNQPRDIQYAVKAITKLHSRPEP